MAGFVPIILNGGGGGGGAAAGGGGGKKEKEIMPTPYEKLITFRNYLSEIDKSEEVQDKTLSDLYDECKVMLLAPGLFETEFASTSQAG